MQHKAGIQVKLWVKTVGLYKILAISLIASLLNHFCGDEKVNLPTLAGGIHFVETPVTFLLATVVPTFVYFNRAKLAFPEAGKTHRAVKSLEQAIFPLLISIGFCVGLLAQTANGSEIAYFFAAALFGLTSEFFYRTKPRLVAVIPISVFLCIQILNPNLFTG